MESPDQPAEPGEVEPVNDHVSAVENSSLQQLRQELNDDAAVDHFVADFLDLLDDRLTGLDRFMQRSRIEDTVTALLTIETSGLMVGARELAAIAAELRRAVGDADTRHSAALLLQLHEAGEQTKRLLGGV